MSKMKDSFVTKNPKCPLMCPTSAPRTYRRTLGCRFCGRTSGRDDKVNEQRWRLAALAVNLKEKGKGESLQEEGIDNSVVRADMVCDIGGEKVSVPLVEAGWHAGARSFSGGHQHPY